MKRNRILLLPLCIFFIVSCSHQRVLVLTDPVFDHFAKEQIPFFKASRLFLYIKNGFFPHFIENPYTGSSNDVQSVINSGKYSALVTNYLSYYDLELPDEMKTVLVGGSAEIRFPSLSHVVFVNSEALKYLSQKLQKEWSHQGKLPVTVLWESSRTGADDLDFLFSAWSDKTVLEENTLVVRQSDKDVQNRIESFFKGYDFTSGEYIITGACPPVMMEFLNSLPAEGNFQLILSVPDNPDLPESVVGLITPSYKKIEKAGVEALKAYSPGGIIEIQNIYKNK